MRAKFLLSAVAVALAVGFGMADEKKADKAFDDATFIKTAGSGGMLEVKLGELAEKMAVSEDVKTFGAKLVKDHTTANLKLLEIAKVHKVIVPDKLMAEHQKHVDHFKEMKKGEEFDKHFVEHMVKDHEEDIAAFEQASKEAKSADLKEFATKTLPTLKEHLAMAKKLHGDKK